MVWLVAEKVQKISKRICFPSGNIQVDPVKSCGKNADHQRERIKLNTSPPMIAYAESPGKSAVEM